MELESNQRSGLCCLVAMREAPYRVKSRDGNAISVSNGEESRHGAPGRHALRTPLGWGLALLAGLTSCSRASSHNPVSDPRVFNVTYSFEFPVDPAHLDRAKDLKVWLPLPREWDNQKEVQIVSVTPPPQARYTDPDFGNPMLFWDFGKEPVANWYRAEVRFRLVTYETRFDIDPRQVRPYSKTNADYLLYTRDEHTVHLTPKVSELAKEAVGGETNPYLQARRVCEFVYRKVRYKVLDFAQGRGTDVLLEHPLKDAKNGEEYYEGCCNQRSALFVALCRALGIPARSVFGFKDDGFMLYGQHPRSLYDFETNITSWGTAGARHVSYLAPHTWSEFYLEGIGWVPVEDGTLGRLNNRRFILGKGRDIKIGPHAPEKGDEGYGSQWVLLREGRADEVFSAVWNVAKIRNAKITVIVSRQP
jgi:transglutaminase-like putative cysteine protease